MKTRFFAIIGLILTFAALPDARAAQFDLPGPPGSDSFGTSVTVLPNGNFVITDPDYDAWPNANVGAVYLYHGVTLAVITTRTGTNANDQVGSGGVTVLSNGNHVVASPGWNGGRGAVTWGGGTTGLTGAVSAANSLVGSTAGDGVGGDGVTALSNGNYVAGSPYWQNGTVARAGAVTWGSRSTGVRGVVSAANSLVGIIGNTCLNVFAYDGVTALANGNYVVRSPWWGGDSQGAVTWGNGTLRTTGLVSQANSVLGTAGSGGASMNFAYDCPNTRLLVGYPAHNRVSFFYPVSLPSPIALEQPLNVHLANGDTRVFGAPLGTNASLTFTIKNTDIGDLTGLGITIDGSDAALFTVTAGPAAPLRGPFGSTTFTVRFTPASTGMKTAALHIGSNDAQQKPFNINLIGRVLSSMRTLMATG
jgi:hypothetical protein